MKLIIILIFISYYLISIQALYNTIELSIDIIDGQTISTCLSQNYNYFDISSLSCGYCDSNTNYQSNLNSVNLYGDPLSCSCKTGYIQSSNSCSNDQSGLCVGITCTSCLTLNQTTYSDNSACVSCDNSTIGISSTTHDCACKDPYKYILVETDKAGNKLVSKQCLACPTGSAVIVSDIVIAGKYYTADRYTCQYCPDSLMTMTVTASSYSCSCPNGYTLVGISTISQQSCILTTISSSYIALEQSAQIINYYSIGATLESLTLSHYFVKSASYCASYGGSQHAIYCQILANLCVLQLYDDTAIVCSTYLSILKSRNTNFYNDVINWGIGMPWLYYPTTTSTSTSSNLIISANKICHSTIYQDTVSLNNQKFNYVVAQYSLNGSFLGFSNINNLFNYCSKRSPVAESDNSKWQIFGYTLEKTNYYCDLSSLMSTNQIFYELYLVDNSNNKYLPIPIRFIYDNIHNKNNVKYLCNNEDLLVNRFFLFDRHSGISSTSSLSSSVSSTQDNNYIPNVIRYASSISFDVDLNLDELYHIYIPVVTIVYKDIVPGGWSSSLKTSNTISDSITSSDTTVTYSIIGSYSMKLIKFHSYISGFFIANFIIYIFFVILRYYNWAKRNARIVTDAHYSTDFGGLNTRVIGEIMLLLMHSYVLFFLPFMMMICWYAFVTFKLQKFPSFLLPPSFKFSLYNYNSSYYIFVVNLYILAFFQLFYVLVVVVYRHSNNDIYFIDWEINSDNSTNRATTNTTNNNNDNNNNQPNENPTSNLVNSKKTNVSIWRTIFIANEYIKLVIKRQINLSLVLLFVLMIFLGLSYQYDATEQPNLKNKSIELTNPVLRFTISTFWFFIFSFSQFLYKYLLYDRYINEMSELKFIDLCTISKISVFIVTENYFGYYIHGRSPHTKADVDMIDLIHMLYYEEAGLTVDRSLDNNTPDIQTFQMYLSHEFKVEYNKIKSNIIPTNSLLNRPPNKNITTSNQSNVNYNKIPSDNSMIAYNNMILYLKEFIHNNFQANGLKRTTKEPTYYDLMFNLPPNLTTPNQPSIFYPDRYYEYSKIWFLGQERELLILNLLTYTLVDLWTSSATVSALLCYLLDFFITFLRLKYTQKMISRKTLIDERFLVDYNCK